jgi:hypothetical protein
MMVWVTWRQHRVQVLVAAAFLVVAGGLLLAHWLRTDSVVSAFDAGSVGQSDAFGAQFGQVSSLLRWSVVVPALIGLFWGTPVLAREYERGTHLLAWTQSVPRQSWFAVKLGGLGAAVTVAGLAFGFAMHAWAGQFPSTVRAAGPLANLDLFVVTGIVPAAWWLFGFMLGVATGAVLRKLLPAMAVTLAVFIAAYAGMTMSDVRLHYATPVHLTDSAPVVRGDNPVEINIPPGAEAQLPAGALLVAHGWLDERGTPLTGNEQWSCAYESDFLGCMRNKEYTWFADYHPADRYWRFQLTESGLLLAASLALGFVVWRRGGRA